jgi:DNA polymerase I-like protein with 3'-5' exonuclease and polymerase domains
MQEIMDNVDMHEINRSRFSLPERRIAKFFLFRLIYGGTAYAYAYDPDFTHVSTSPKYWQKVIDEAYAKYKVLQETHTNWVQTVIRNRGRLVVPTGREYEFAPVSSPRGEMKWPRTQILNYPVQGLGHDLMAIVRTLLFARLRYLFVSGVRLISTVHDSIDIDCPSDMVDHVVKIVQSCFDDAPARFKEWFKVDFNLPLRCEIFTGMNLKDLVEVK